MINWLLERNWKPFRLRQSHIMKSVFIASLAMKSFFYNMTHRQKLSSLWTYRTSSEPILVLFLGYSWIPMHRCNIKRFVFLCRNIFYVLYILPLYHFGIDVIPMWGQLDFLACRGQYLHWIWNIFALTWSTWGVIRLDAKASASFYVFTRYREKCCLSDFLFRCSAVKQLKDTLTEVSTKNSSAQIISLQKKRVMVFMIITFRIASHVVKHNFIS